jgi:hypothetical protein
LRECDARRLCCGGIKPRSPRGERGDDGVGARRVGRLAADLGLNVGDVVDAIADDDAEAVGSGAL